MAKGLEHEIQDDYGSQYYSRTYLNFVQYGRCLRSPYVQNQLWFVTIVLGSSSESKDELRLPEQDHTFLVSEKYARPVVIQKWKRDVNRWSEVAHKIFKGPWCEHYECLWKDVPVYNHQLPTGTKIKYGYCRTQPRNSERELHFVAFETGSTYVVDHICAIPEFIDRIGDDQSVWLRICWCHLRDEVEWDELQTGTLGGGYVRRSQFVLDSPYIPSTVDEIPSIVDELMGERNGYEHVPYEFENQIVISDLDMSLLNRQKFRVFLTEYFNLSELRNICYDLEIEYENLGEEKDNLAREMLRYVERYNRIDKLVALCIERRQDINVYEVVFDKRPE